MTGNLQTHKSDTYKQNGETNGIQQQFYIRQTDTTIIDTNNGETQTNTH